MAAAKAIATSWPPGPWPPRADGSAWIAQAYVAHAPELAAYVARNFGGHVTPEDVVHEAFARLVRDTAAGRRPTCVRAWLYRVAHNLAVDELRRPVRFEPDAQDERAPAAWTPSAEAEFETWSLGPEIRQAIDTLSRAGRTSILMAADGYSGREIASAVGRTELATRALLCRTRRVLRVALGGAGGIADLGVAPYLAA
jgi:RNA polymerase sigma-70 factor, ECF subfamily